MTDNNTTELKQEIPADRLEIKAFLDEYKLTSDWAIMILDKNGISTDRSEFSLILSGRRNGPKVENMVSILKKAIPVFKKAMKKMYAEAKNDD